MKRLKRHALFFLLGLAQASALAGAQEGPFVIWLNLSENKAIDSLIQEQLAKRENCSEPRMLVSPPPDWISHELIRKGLLKADKKSIDALDRLLRKPAKGLADEGFDGIVVYDEIKGARFSSLPRTWKLVAREKVATPINKENQWKAFCVSLPEITRPI